MSQFQKAADDIKAFASRIRGFLDVADTLERIGNLEQAESEAKNKTDQAQQGAVAAENILNSKQEDISKLSAKLDEAAQSADSIIADAKQRAMAIVDEASVRAHDVVRDLSAKKDAIELEIVELSQKHDGLLTFISERENELSGIVAKIAEAREKVASLFK